MTRFLFFSFLAKKILKNWKNSGNASSFSPDNGSGQDEVSENKNFNLVLDPGEIVSSQYSQEQDLQQQPDNVPSLKQSNSEMFSHQRERHKRSDSDPEPSSNFQVSERQQSTDDSEVNGRLEEFVKYFVKVFEIKLHAYILILEGETKKAELFSDSFSEIIGQGVGGVTGIIIGFFLGSLVAGANLGTNLGAKVGKTVGKKIGGLVDNKKHTKNVIELKVLIDLFLKDTTNFRRVLVEAGFDVFQSFEIQFMNVTTDQCPKKAMQQLAKDATNRAIHYFTKKKDALITEGIILGKSKIEPVFGIPIPSPNIKTPGFKINYKFGISSEKKWYTASLYEEVGLVINGNSSREITSYYEKKGRKSKTDYGYRRLLTSESWNKLKDNYIESYNVPKSEFTDYKYILSSKDSEQKTKDILEKINLDDKGLAEERITKIIEEVKDNIIEEINALKKQCHRYKADLEKLEMSLQNLKIDEYLTKFKQYFEEAKQERQKIVHSIEEGRKENREGHSKTQEGLREVTQQLARLNPQETQTEGIISGLGIIKYYYISRTLNRNIEIKEDFKKEISNFFVTSSSQDDKSKLQKNQDIVLISNTCEDFKELCNKYKNHNIHWLKKEKSKFIWQLSLGSLSELRKFVDDKKVQSSEVKKISNIKDKVVIISAGPGMGKSTILTHLALEQKKISSSVKAIRVNLNDHTDKLSGANFEMKNAMIEFLKEITEIKDLEDLNSSILLFDGFDEIASNIEYKSKAIKLVKFLKNEVKNLWVTTRPYAQYDLEDELSVFSFTLEPLSEVTQKEFLEKFWKTNFIYDVIKDLTIKIGSEIEDEEIKSMAGKVSKIIELKIVEWKDDDDNLKQIKSLTSEFNPSKKVELVKKITDLIDKQLGKQHKVYEKVKDIVEKVDNTSNLEEIKNLIQARANSYAEELIAKFSKIVSDKEREFTGVPLQVRMLAEAFQEEFYEDFKKFYDLEPNQRGLDKLKLPERLNLLDLYERFIENKHKIYFVEKGRIDLTNQHNKKTYNESRKPFIEKHRLLALSLLFSEKDLKNFLSKDKKDKIEKLKKDIELGEENTGIVHQIIDGKSHFIHRTFAEYFAADFFDDMLKKTKDHPKYKQVRDFLREHIFKAENEVIRNFFDRMLAKDKEGQNQYEIHKAVLNNDKDKINELLSDSQKAENINSLDKGERTALHLAAGYGLLDIVKDLLGHGASISTKDQIFGWGPLSYADKCSYWGIAELLLDNDNGDDMFEAKKNVDTCYEGKRTLLHIAAQEGYIEFVKVLVEKLKANFRATDNYNRIPLHLAAGYGHLEIVEFLLNKDKETASNKEYSSKTPLDLAIYRGQLEVVQYLGEKSDLSEKELNEMRLNAAASNGDYKVVEMLLKKGVDVNSEVLGWTPLHQAAMDGSLKVVQLLVNNGAEIGHLGDNHPNPNVRDGWTPLHGAANNGRYDVVKYLVEELLKKDADINPANKDGYTPLHTAARGGHLNVVKYLIEELEEKKVDINIADKKGTTPLHAAAFHGKYNIVEYLVGKEANINAIDKWGATVIFSAACYNDHKIINFLLNRKANIDSDEGVIGKLGITVLHVAAMYGASEIVKRLVKEKITNVNAGENSFTPLHLAALSDSFETIKYLINKGAKVDALIHFSNIAKVLKDEGAVLKGTSMDTLVEKLTKFVNYLDSLVSSTPYYIYRILEYTDEKSLALLEQDQGFVKNVLNKIKIGASCYICQKYFKEQVNRLKEFVSEKKEIDDRSY